MNISTLLEGYYAGTLSDAEEEQLELLMRAGHPGIPEQERKLYLAVANLPIQEPARKKKSKIALKIASAAAAVSLIVGLGTHIYMEQQQQQATEQEILEIAMGNVSMALRESDKSREKVASIFKGINTDSISNAKIVKPKTR